MHISMAKDILIKGIEKKFGDFKVIDNLDLEIKEAEMVGLIGRSGCGKTTLLKILLGLIKIEKGRIEFNEKDITNDTSKLKKIVGYCTQENSFYHELTVKENMQYFARMYGIGLRERNKRIKELLDLMKLEHAKDTNAGRISGGMKRRTDFAIALMHNPDILVLDEPTTGLDPILEESTFKLIKEINKKGKTIIIISHNLGSLQKYCTKIAIMDKGKIIEILDTKKIPKKLSKNNKIEEAFETLFKEKAKEKEE